MREPLQEVRTAARFHQRASVDDEVLLEAGRLLSVPSIESETRGSHATFCSFR